MDRSVQGMRHEKLPYLPPCRACEAENVTMFSFVWHEIWSGNVARSVRVSTHRIIMDFMRVIHRESRDIQLIYGLKNYLIFSLRRHICNVLNIKRAKIYNLVSPFFSFISTSCWSTHPLSFLLIIVYRFLQVLSFSLLIPSNWRTI